MVLPLHLRQTQFGLATSDATAPVVYPQLVLRALDGVAADTTTADSAGVLAEFL